MMTGTKAAVNREFDLVLVFSGGNALGAFQAGVYQALHEHNLLPGWIVGASIGAINGALIAGSSPERRIDVLRSFWRPDGGTWGPGMAWFPSSMEITRRTAAVSWTAAAGRVGLFGPLLSSLTPWSADQTSLFDTEQLAATLEAHVDFALLNGGPCRFTATAVDLATGDEVVFDSPNTCIDARHIRASAALPVAFPPVDIDGRRFVDGGLSANLPLDPVLEAASPRPTLCLAVDLLPLNQALPRTLGEAASRMQDLVFAAQSRRTIARWQSACANHDDVRTTLVRLAYADQSLEVAGKALDFSGPTVEQRWSAGHASAIHLIACLDSGFVPIGEAGLNVIDLEPRLTATE